MTTFFYKSIILLSFFQIYLPYLKKLKITYFTKRHVKKKKRVIKKISSTKKSIILKKNFKKKSPTDIGRDRK